ncbi:4-hydroxy-tetrahydrodipicolinate reductase [archaeon SCG-AAA382B04]|nr:4-hydroxy-tetrahydrodipicolinate reductase [archaeon SCG-AAA382B04]
MTKVGVTGALGRMGSNIVQSTVESEDLDLEMAVEAPGQQKIGKDIGELLSLGKVGVELISSKKLEEELTKTNLDVLIDFTVPKATLNFVEICAKKNVDMVIGTTGFDDSQENRLEETIKGSNISAVISPNYSTGINVFWELVRKAVDTLDYDAEIVEVHHNNKKDAPSGTAKKTAEIIREVRGEGEFVMGRKGLSPRDQGEIGIHAVRAGDIIGDHTVYLSGNNSGERIEITHRAQNRQPFINGALKSAGYVVKQKEGIFGMKDVLGL